MCICAGVNKAIHFHSYGINAILFSNQKYFLIGTFATTKKASGRLVHSKLSVHSAWSKRIRLIELFEPKIQKRRFTITARMLRLLPFRLLESSRDKPDAPTMYGQQKFMIQAVFCLFTNMRI